MVEKNKIIVSFFDNYKSPDPSGVVDLQQHLFCSAWKEDISAIRFETDSAKRREIKIMLPAITPSGVFSTRCNDGIIQRSGLICIDIDSKQNPCLNDWEALKSSVAQLPGLWYAGLSASGRGIFALFKVKYPLQHNEHFSAIDMDMKSLGIVIDQSGKDICRLRGVSFDEHPFFNPDTASYNKLITKAQTAGTQRGCSGDIEQAAINVGKLVTHIEHSGANIADSYPDWFAIGRSLASQFGEFGREWYHIISRQSSKYKTSECDRQYTNCLRCCSKTSISTFFHICKQFGITLNNST